MTVCKSKIKEIALPNHKTRTQHNGPIRTQQIHANGKTQYWVFEIFKNQFRECSITKAKTKGITFGTKTDFNIFEENRVEFTTYLQHQAAICFSGVDDSPGEGKTGYP